MKNAIRFASVVFLISMFSCQDTDEITSSVPDLAEYKSVGMQIPTETGARWIDAYNRQNNVSGRLLGILYSVNSMELEAALASVPDLTGVAFHYGLDEAGEKHIILIPVGNALRLWDDIPGRMYVDTNTSTAISQATASEWAENYKAENPASIWFHYFGRNILDNILSTTGFAALDVMPALNDLDLSPELLLIVGNTLNLLGRTNAETNVYDASYPCPKCDVQ